MNINKITILPINSYCKSVTLIKPSTEEAKLLIADKINCRNQNPIFHKKLPKELKDFVNARCWVSSTIKK
jgi:hypothetical protein